MSSTAETEAPLEPTEPIEPTAPVSEDWNTLPWRKLEQSVYRLQKRIYRASARGNLQAVRNLQRLLLKSQAARLLAVRRVTQDNQGKKTAGIDGVKAVRPTERLALAERLHPRQWHEAAPVRRVYIPKPGKTEKRPLGIPTMGDRAQQALAKLALEPEWEARFEANSYGFRPGRSCQDAITAIYASIHTKHKYVLDADIKGCFDHIDHQALLTKLNTFPTLRRAVKGWLKAGMIEFGHWSPTERGTPQGGVISPLLANIALHGLETAVVAGTRRQKQTTSVIRYADDFVILHADQTVLQQAQEIAAHWLAGIGLELKPEKTRLTDTRAGFDFLGFHIQHYPAGTRHTAHTTHGQPMGFTTRMEPTQEAVKRHLRETHRIIRAFGNASQETLIQQLNPVIGGWARYYRNAQPSRTYKHCQQVVFTQLWQWACRRHHTKGRSWIKARYWGTDHWVFRVPTVSLLQYTAIHVTRRPKVQGTKSPYDGDLVYWSKRLQQHPMLTTRLGKLLHRQHRQCAWCGLSLKDGDLIEVDHVIPTHRGGSDSLHNLQALHLHCHDQKTAQDKRLQAVLAKWEGSADDNG